MNESENKNRETRIKQQKNLFWKRTFILIALVLVITIVFVAMKNNAMGTEIGLDEFEQKLNAEQIKSIHLNEEKIIVHGINGESYWLYSRDNVEKRVLDIYRESILKEDLENIYINYKANNRGLFKNKIFKELHSRILAYRNKKAKAKVIIKELEQLIDYKAKLNEIRAWSYGTTN